MIHRVEHITDDRVGSVKQGRTCATKALIWCLNEQGATIPISTMERPEIINHHHLKSYPELLVSISHTSNNNMTVGFAAIQKMEKIKSIGIDIEFENRIVNKKTTKFFINEHDTLGSLSLLEIWTYKEAAFKAVAPIFPNVTLLNNLWLKNLEFGIVGEENLIGSISSKLVTVANRTAILTTATL